jgi:hypothetical protein
MFGDDGLYLDRVQLAARGWTRTLTERFLPHPDRWATVDHWRNYKGKATYFVEPPPSRIVGKICNGPKRRKTQLGSGRIINW